MDHPRSPTPKRSRLCVHRTGQRLETLNKEKAKIVNVSPGPLAPDDCMAESPIPVDTFPFRSGKKGPIQRSSYHPRDIVRTPASLRATRNRPRTAFPFPAFRMLFNPAHKADMHQETSTRAIAPSNIPALQHWAQGLLKQNKIEKVYNVESIPFLMPCVVVYYDDREPRITHDFSMMSKYCKKLPWVTKQSCWTTVKRLCASNMSWYAKCDLSKGFHSVPMRLKDRQFACFEVPGMGYFRYKTMPMGHMNSPAHFHFCMLRLWQKLSARDRPYVSFFQDDWLIAGSSRSACAKRQKRVIRLINENGFKCNPKKCTRPTQDLPALGYNIKGCVVMINKKARRKIRQAKGKELHWYWSHYSVLDPYRLVGSLIKSGRYAEAKRRMRSWKYRVYPTKPRTKVMAYVDGSSQAAGVFIPADYPRCAYRTSIPFKAHSVDSEWLSLKLLLHLIHTRRKIKRAQIFVKTDSMVMKHGIHKSTNRWPSLQCRRILTAHKDQIKLQWVSTHVNLADKPSREKFGREISWKQILHVGSEAWFARHEQPPPRQGPIPWHPPRLRPTKIPESFLATPRRLLYPGALCLSIQTASQADGQGSSPASKYSSPRLRQVEFALGLEDMSEEEWQSSRADHFASLVGRLVWDTGSSLEFSPDAEAYSARSGSYSDTASFQTPRFR